MDTRSSPGAGLTRVRARASPGDAAGSARLSIRQLAPRNYEALCTLASQSELPSLAEAGQLRRSVEADVGFGAFLEDELVGCCFIIHNLQKHYWIYLLGKRVFPIPNVCFYGAFVHPERRGLGIGGALYRHRLDFARGFRTPIVVELYGDGSRSSVHFEAIPGYYFYLKRGFREIGYTVDEDGGKILAAGIE